MMKQVHCASCHRYLSVSGCGRQRLPREGRSRVSGFLSVLHAWMFRYLNMCTLPLRQIWNGQNAHKVSLKMCVRVSTRWCSCTRLTDCEGQVLNSTTNKIPTKTIVHTFIYIHIYFFLICFFFLHDVYITRTNITKWEAHTYLCGWRLHRIVVQDDVLQLPEFPVNCRNLCDLIAGEVKSDERQVSQLCR